MSSQDSSFDDTRMEIIMGRLLQVGVLLASVVVALGGAIYLKAHHGSVPDYRVFASEPIGLRDPGLFFEQVVRGDGVAVIALGVLLLIATPIARIAFSIFGYLLEKDYLYTVLTAIVLLVILWNF